MSNSAQLKRMNCANNLIESLDLSANTQMTQVNCPHNRLSSITFPDSGKLMFCDCSYNRLTELTADSSVKGMFCHHNFIQDTTALTDRYGTKNNVILPQFENDIAKSIIADIPNQTYTGSAIVPSPTVTLNGDVPAGETDSDEIWTSDNPTRSSDLSVQSVSLSAFSEDGTLEPGVDYTLAHENNINTGTATITITGKAPYTGTATKTFAVVPADIAQANIANIADQTYTGSAITPDPTLVFNGKTLVKGTDYTLAYASNTAVGTATITITGTGNFTGTTTTTFKIVESGSGSSGTSGNGASGNASSQTPGTGDPANPVIPAALLLIASSSVAFAAYRRARQRQMR